MFKKFILSIITLYQKIFSPDTGLLKKAGVVRGGVCAFYPTCSEYSKKVIGKYGILKGGLRSIKRITRCHPWQEDHFDDPN